MQNLTIKKIIEFKAKSERSKKTFVANLKVEKEKNSDGGGGDYWQRSLTAISNGYKLNTPKPIKEKMQVLEDLVEIEQNKKTKNMYQRNLDILSKYEDVDFKRWRPSTLASFLKKHKVDLVLSVRGLNIEAKPQYVFSFGNNEDKEIGAIWFIAKLGGFKKDELGMFADITFRYLTKSFGKDYSIDPKHCIAVDVFNDISVNYSHIQKNQITPLLQPTIEEMKKFM